MLRVRIHELLNCKTGWTSCPPLQGGARLLKGGACPPLNQARGLECLDQDILLFKVLPGCIQIFFWGGMGVSKSLTL